MSQPALSEVERGVRRGAFENVGCAMHTVNSEKVPHTFNSLKSLFSIFKASCFVFAHYLYIRQCIVNEIVDIVKAVVLIE